LGNRKYRRYGAGWKNAGYKIFVQVFAHSFQPGTCTGAQPYSTLVRQSSRKRYQFIQAPSSMKGCVSAMRIGKQMQFFGARCNLAKALLYAINGGKDEMTGEQIAPMFAPVETEYLDYEDVMKRFDMVLDWVARLYMNTLNIIHYMHDKYAYEALQMALHDKDVFRTMACGIAGLSVVADSLSAIKYAKVKPIRNENNLVVDYEVEGDYPKFGNNDERVDEIAVQVVKMFMNKLRKQRAYRSATPTLSILTITSNVVYGKKTGNTPDVWRREQIRCMEGI